MQILIAYASISGNTQKVAKHLYDYVSHKYAKHKVKLIDLITVQSKSLSAYDLFIVGASTWMDGEPNDIALAFLDDLNTAKADLKNLPCAIFGLGDSRYEKFCTVVESMSESLTEHQAKVLKPSHKIDGNPTPEIMTAAEDWIEQILKQI